MAADMGLRARKKLATANALQQAAIEMFLERGYVKTTVQDITDAAGVSQRTFFRYYATKDAVLTTEHERREEELVALLAARPDEPLSATAAHIIDALARDTVERADLVRVQTEVFVAVPMLADRASGHHDRLASILAGHAARVLGVDEDSDARPRLFGDQVVRAWTTSVALWLAGERSDDLTALAVETLRLARTDPALVDA